MQSKRTLASNMALGGILAALAVVFMSLGTLIPVATYVCPMVCCVLCQVVLKISGRRIAWAWYGAVAILSLLMAPDKEAAAVFLFLGNYPILKPWMDRRRGTLLWKAAYFNSSILVLYWLLLKILGMDQLVQEFAQMGRAMTALLLILGNVTFFLLDKVLSRRFRKSV